MARLGLVVNPVAGMGGPLGLKGTDQWTFAELVRLGGIARSSARAAEAVARLSDVPSLEMVTAAGSMGEASVEAAGMKATVVYRPEGPDTGATDTTAAVRAMADLDCRLILFAGGDGTARDVHRAIGERVPALGIPAGVKIQSAAFGMSPVIAGSVAAAFLLTDGGATRPAEVADLDEDAYRAGRLQARLFGYLSVPDRPDAIQGTKVRTVSDREAIGGIGRTVVARLVPGTRYVIGPGSTAKAVLRELGLPVSLLGIDVLLEGRIIGSDLSATDLLELTAPGPTNLVVSPIGGQGHLFGRGNQQLSPELIRRAGPDGLIVVASPGKLASLRGRPLFVDTGDRRLDLDLMGWVRIITGWNREIVYALAGSTPPDPAPMKVALFVTCFNDLLFPDVGRATVRLLERLGIEVEVPAAQTCCGQIHFNTGYRDECLPLVGQFARAFARYDAIVSPSPSCTAMVRHHYATIGAHAAARRRDALSDDVAGLVPRVHELTEFLIDVLGVTDVGARFPHTVTFHPTCHSVRMLGIGDRPQRLLRAVDGLTLLDLPGAEQCCGFGGTFAVKNADTSVAMGSDKVAAVRSTGAEVLTAADTSCLMQLGGLLSRGRAPVRVMHLVQILASRADA